VICVLKEFFKFVKVVTWICLPRVRFIKSLKYSIETRQHCTSSVSGLLLLVSLGEVESGVQGPEGVLGVGDEEGLQGWRDVVGVEGLRGAVGGNGKIYAATGIHWSVVML